MSRKHKKRLIVVADFETTTTPDDCRVWLWGVMSIDNTDRFVYDNNIDSFIDTISSQPTICYFHNLRFDGVFIVDAIMRDGFTHTSEQFPKAGEFSTLISSQGQWYSVKVTWRNGVTTEFRDSLKKLPMSVENVSRAFNLEDVKGELDYTALRPVNHVPTADEIDYLRRDLVIIAQALVIQFSQGMDKLTVGSDSLSEYKTLMTVKHFERLFPIVPDAIDADIRRAYRGGFTYADKRFKGVRQGGGHVFDVNSLYPFVMYSSLLPYGMPRWSDSPSSTSEFPLFIVSITFTAKLKKNHIPCIQVKGSYLFKDTEYVEMIDEPVTMSVTNVDLELFHKHYDMNIIAVNGGYEFRASHGFFNTFIDKWSKIKSESTGGKRALAKLVLNSLYGKFATNPNITPKVPVMENDRVKLVLGEEDTRDPVYTAMGVFITAYARSYTITAAQEHYDVFAYADTDSLHLLCEDVPTSLDIDPNRLGAWKHEYQFTKSLYVRAKAYMELKVNGEYETHIAGLPERVTDTLTFDSMVDGMTFHGKLNPKIVPGGVVLENVTYTLKF